MMTSVQSGHRRGKRRRGAPSARIGEEAGVWPKRPKRLATHLEPASSSLMLSQSMESSDAAAHHRRRSTGARAASAPRAAARPAAALRQASPASSAGLRASCARRPASRRPPPASCPRAGRRGRGRAAPRRPPRRQRRGRSPLRVAKLRRPPRGRGATAAPGRAPTRGARGIAVQATPSAGQESLRADPQSHGQRLQLAATRRSRAPTPSPGGRADGGCKKGASLAKPPRAMKRSDGVIRAASRLARRGDEGSRSRISQVRYN